MIQKALALSLTVLATLASSGGARADSNQINVNNENFYRLQPAEIREVPPTAAELYGFSVATGKKEPKPDPAKPDPAKPANPNVNPDPSDDSPGDLMPDWGMVQRIGDKVIQIIQAGKPVTNVTRDAVSVVPGGVTAWSQLSGWKGPVTKVYSVTAKNLMNITVVDLRLKVSANYGGNIDGRGKYLANVVVVPTSVYVFWGFGCDVWTEHHDPVNTADTANPVAGLGFDIRYKYSSMLQSQTGTQDYFLTGEGEIRELQ